MLHRSSHRSMWLSSSAWLCFVINASRSGTHDANPPTTPVRNCPRPRLDVDVQQPGSVELCISCAMRARDCGANTRLLPSQWLYHVTDLLRAMATVSCGDCLWPLASSRPLSPPRHCQQMPADSVEVSLNQTRGRSACCVLVFENYFKNTKSVTKTCF